MELIFKESNIYYASPSWCCDDFKGFCHTMNRRVDYNGRELFDRVKLFGMAHIRGTGKLHCMFCGKQFNLTWKTDNEDIGNHVLITPHKTNQDKLEIGVTCKQDGVSWFQIYKEDIPELIKRLNEFRECELCKAVGRLSK